MITQNEISILRSLKKTAIILLLIYRLDKPIGQEEIAEILEMDRRTAGNHLKSLLRYGLITRTHYQNGYILSQHGRQMILGQTSQDLAHLNVALLKQDPPEALPPIIQDLPEALEAHEPAQALQTDDQRERETKKGTICAHTQFVLKEEVKEVNTINLTTSSSDLSKTCEIASGKIAPSPEKQGDDRNDMIKTTMSKLLRWSALLFGDPGVIMDQLPDRPSEMVLGWLAHAYQQRHRLRSPAGLVYSQLKKGNLPGENYLEHPETYLPFDYLLAVGYRLPTEADQDIAEPEDPGPEEIVMEDPSLSIPIRGNITARRAWEIVLEQLRMDMPKAAYDTWLASTYPKRWSDNCLTIGTESSYACDWLSSRLTSKIRRLLSGILSLSMEIKFEI